MTHISNKIIGLAVATTAGLAVLFAPDNVSSMRSGLVTTADARIGRPLTPMSYAGVARRTTHRAYYGAAAGAAAVGAAAAGAAYYGSSSCYQAVDAYGRVYTRCP
jgi:hypothetical protein